MKLKKITHLSAIYSILSIFSTAAIADNPFTAPQLDYDKYGIDNWVDNENQIDVPKNEDPFSAPKQDIVQHTSAAPPTQDQAQQQSTINQNNSNDDSISAAVSSADEQQEIASKSLYRHATDKKIYTGLQLGANSTELNDDKVSKTFMIDDLLFPPDTPFNTNTDKSGFAGRIYGGYQFLPYLGLEVGYAKYSNADSSIQNVPQLADEGITKLSAKNKVSAIDAMAVFTLPVTQKVFLNAKAGVAYVFNQYELDISLDNNDSDELLKTRTFRPKFAIGADYYFTDRLALGLAYEMTLGQGEPYQVDALAEQPILGNSSFSPRLQMLALNLKYYP